jgi:hypothetical protein
MPWDCALAGNGRLQPMRIVLRLMVLVALPLTLAALAAMAAALQREPAVALRAQPDQNDVARALNILRAHDPRQARAGVMRAVQINQHEIDVLLNHAGRRWFDTATQVQVEQGTAVVRASFHLPQHPLAFIGTWLNVEVHLVQTGGLPAVESWQIGGLPLPAALAETALAHAAARAGFAQELQLAAELVQRVDFQPQRLAVVYAWQADSTDRVLSALLPPADQQRLRVYNDRLAELVAAVGPQWTTSLAPLLGPLFKLAQDRSRDGDAAAENRAVLVVMAVFATGRNLGSLVPAARNWPRPRRLQLTLSGRDDFPLHFLISAALAAEGTGPLSKAIGIYKEVADSRHGSGFSFNDMAPTGRARALANGPLHRPGNCRLC